MNSDTNFPFRWATSGFVFLGIKVLPNVSNLRSDHFMSTVRTYSQGQLKVWPSSLLVGLIQPLPDVTIMNVIEEHNKTQFPGQ